MSTPSGIVTLLTDFGLQDGYVASMKGAILQVFPRAVLVDVTHAVSGFSILQGAYLLESAWRHFPAGTVHLVVIDPEVGTTRPAVAIRVAQHFFVGPDNGLFTFLPDEGLHAVSLTPAADASPTFHGRDVFAPAAARLAGGSGLEELGPATGRPVRLAEAWAAKVGEAWRVQVLHCDHFGNVITNLPARALTHLRSVNGVRVRAVRTYAEGARDELIALVGSSGRVEVALRGGRAAERLRTAPGETLVIT